MSVSGYSASQIKLHWIIAALVVVQVVLHEGIVTVYTALKKAIVYLTNPVGLAILRT